VVCLSRRVVKDVNKEKAKDNDFTLKDKDKNLKLVLKGVLKDKD